MIKFSIMQRSHILNKTKGVCARCGLGLKLGETTVDHYIPVSKGGPTRITNLYPLCKECNVKKANDIIPPDKVYPYLESMNSVTDIEYEYEYYNNMLLNKIKSSVKYIYLMVDNKLVSMKFSVNRHINYKDFSLEIGMKKNKSAYEKVGIKFGYTNIRVPIIDIELNKPKFMEKYNIAVLVSTLNNHQSNISELVELYNERRITMVLDNELKKRFCKDNKLPINVFESPYFEQRIKLFEKESVLEQFKALVASKFNGDTQEYFEYYNKLKDDIINYIKESEAFKALNSDDMNNYVYVSNIRQSDVYKDMNVGKHFISIDMKKANFSALVNYSKTKGLYFFDSYDWDKFMSMFTDEEYFYNLKYIRQVVFGNCNCKRQITYEKHLMGKVLEQLIDENYIKLENVYSICSDEIIIYADNMDDNLINSILNQVYKLSNSIVPLRLTYFKLGKVLGTKAFIKDNIISSERGESSKFEIKCAQQSEQLFIQRALNNQEITEDDKVFISDGRLAKYLEVPQVKFCWEQ